MFHPTEHSYAKKKKSKILDLALFISDRQNSVSESSYMRMDNKGVLDYIILSFRMFSLIQIKKAVHLKLV